MSIFKLLVLFFIFTFIILNGLFYTLLQYPCKGLYEKLTGLNTIRRISYPNPVDVVYTWVNGSDKNLISQLNIHKRALYLDKNLHLDGLHHRLSCPYLICGFHDHVLLSPVPINEPDFDIFLHDVSLEIRSMLNSSSTSTTRFVMQIGKSSISRRSGLILHMSIDISTLFINQSDVSLILPHFMPMNFTVSQVFIATDANKVGLPIDEYAFIHGLKEMKDANIETSYRNTIATQTSMNLSLVKASSTSFLVPLPLNLTYNDFALALNNHTNSDTLQVSRAFLIVDTVLATVISDLSESRYQDNEELKYSLRSLDTFLSFYGRIFIVTNGQVPSWLDTDHPKITLVFHSQIFPNSSDIPSFNSAAIEANLHNIPDLANHFIYLNDDVFFGQPVYEEDFFSLSSGYKVYLGWSVPDCVERCPNSWLSDGFCDHECNVPECQWDAGDCIKTHGKVGMVNFASIVNHSLDHMNRMGAMSSPGLGTCSQGCNHNWLADRYCDNSCNVAACAHDLGDCGDMYLLSLPVSVVSKISGQLFPVENGSLAHVLDLRSLITVSDNVTNATIDDVEEVIGSSYTVKYRLLIVLLKSREHCRHCYNTTNKVVNINVVVYSGGIVKYNIVVGIVLNCDWTTETIHYPRTTNYMATGSTLPLTTWPTMDYKTPRTLRFDTHSNESDVSIDRLESLRPLEMSHYRLLLQDGLISLTGYHHLIRQLWLSVEKSQNRSVSLTALHSDLRLENLSWGFLPWERDWLTRLHGDTIVSNRSSLSVSTMRRPLDLYAESLRHSNRILSNTFGLSQRRVPAHGPHFISTSILKAAHRKFHQPWTKTSGHRFRTPFDIQFAFSYFYYLMSEKKNVTVLDVYNRVDTDHSGALNTNELRSLALALGNNNTITDKSMGEFLQKIRNNCICEETSSREFSVNITELLICLNVSATRPDSVIPMYRFTTLDDSDLAFIMISTNRDKVIHDLDSIRKRPKKFFCLNDNLPTDNAHREVVASVHQDVNQFLSYMFPFPSQFEKSPKRVSGRIRTDGFVKVCLGALFITLVAMGLLTTKRLCHTIYRWLCRFAFRDSSPRYGRVQ